MKTIYCYAIGNVYWFLLVKIEFKNNNQKRLFESETKLVKKYGNKVARGITMRMGVLDAAPHLGTVPTTPPDRRHQLDGDRDEQYAVDLPKGRRLVFEVANDPVPRREDGGIDLELVTEILIVEVVDYH